MERNQMRTNETQGVDLQKAVSAIFFITSKFEFSAVFYINNNSFSLGDASLSIDSGGKGYDKKHYIGKYKKYGSHYRRTAGEKSAVREAADAPTEE